MSTQVLIKIEAETRDQLKRFYSVGDLKRFVQEVEDRVGDAGLDDVRLHLSGPLRVEMEMDLP